MPIVNIELDWLNRLLGREFPPEKLTEELEQIGCDVEEVVEVMRSRCPFCNAVLEHPLGQDELKTCGQCGRESETPFETADSMRVVRLDLLAARPDLFDIGGLSRALRGRLGLASGLPCYDVKDSGLTVRINSSVRQPQSWRPYIQCAVMTLPSVDEGSLIAIMKLQENLHWGVGRDRKLASIGVYDLDTLQGDIEYRTLDPDAEPFEPLGMPGESMSGREILAGHPKGAAYAHLLEKHDRYPVLVDSRGQVLSMPPIINSEGTRVRAGTRRIFVDVTGVSQAAVVKALDTLVSSLAELGGAIETVTIVEPDGSERISPDMNPRIKEVRLSQAKRWLGLPLDAASLVESMRRMRFDIEPQEDGDRFTVHFPPYRTDVRHMVDLFEDIAIGYGYENIQPALIPTMTVGLARPEELLSEKIRQVMLGLGFNEIMSLPMSSEELHFERMRLEAPDRHARVSNPKLKAYNILRSHLLTGLLEALHENRRRPMPLRFFELDNVAELSTQAETGTREDRTIAFVEMGKDAGYASTRSRLDALLRELGIRGSYQVWTHPSFVAGRVARFVSSEGEVQAVLGELHPQVLNRFGLGFPVAVAEMRVYNVS